MGRMAKSEGIHIAAAIIYRKIFVKKYLAVAVRMDLKEVSYLSLGRVSQWRKSLESINCGSFHDEF